MIFVFVNQNGRLTTSNTRWNHGHVDEYNHVMSYSSLPLQIEVSGQIELLGPSLVSLTGGQTSIYIKSKKGSGVGKVTIKSSLGQNEIIMKVR